MHKILYVGFLLLALASSRERQAQNKPAAGTLEVRGDVSPGQLQLIVTDDGRGLALRKIEEIAFRKFLLNPSEKHAASTIAQMIFETGFSTSSAVSDISGRGMGMHAVKRYLAQVHGSVELKILQEDSSLDDFMPFCLVMTLPEDCFRYIKQAGDASPVALITDNAS